MILAGIAWPIRKHNPAPAHDLPVQFLGYPASIPAGPQSFAEILARHILHAVEHGSILESHFFKHGSPVMQNMRQVFDARLTYMNFHHADILAGLLSVVGTKWSSVKMLDAA
jgi:hypothetical protein